MDVKIFTGKIKALGDSASSASAKVSNTTYSYIEISDGQMIKKLMTETGLDGKLKEAARAGDEVELHVILHPEGVSGLIGIKAADGRIFASNVVGGTTTDRFVIIAGWILGVLFIPLFGIGLVILWRTWQSSKVLGKYDAARKYISSLPNPILI